MSWTAILTALVLAVLSAYLVLVQGWEVFNAATVLISYLGAILAGFALLIYFVFCSPAERPDFIRTVLTTIRQDLQALLKWFSPKQ